MICYQCNKDVPHLSKRSRCADCEHLMYTMCDDENERLRKALHEIAELVPNHAEVEQRLATLWKIRIKAQEALAA